MEVVLKNNKNLAKKIVSLIEETADNNDNLLTLVVDDEIYKSINLELRGMNLGFVNYGKERLFVTKLGVNIELKKVAKYV